MNKQFSMAFLLMFLTSWNIAKAQTLNVIGVNLDNSWDAVLTSTYNGQTHHLIGTYQGWDSKAIYIGGYNKVHASFASERVYLGHPDVGGFMLVDFITGNVGIGTKTPGTYKLAVEGTIGARKIKITQSSWADYVFEENYKLPSLAEVEKFIKLHKHLPEVPTANEIKEHGADVGDTQVLLLKKIEELTLYLIEQNKKMEEMQKEINQLKQQQSKQTDN